MHAHLKNMEQLCRRTHCDNPKNPVVSCHVHDFIKKWTEAFFFSMVSMACCKLKFMLWHYHELEHSVMRRRPPRFEKSQAHL